MDGTLFGMPLSTLGLICMCLALLWYFVWPKDNTPKPLKQVPGYRPRPVWMHDVLRWFHMLVWMLLATACFFTDAGQIHAGGGLRIVGRCVLCDLRRDADQR